MFGLVKYRDEGPVRLNNIDTGSFNTRQQSRSKAVPNAGAGIKANDREGRAATSPGPHSPPA